MRKALGSAVLAAGAAFAAPAAAQEETIVITATRTPADARELPARVETIDRAEMEARSLATLAEAIGADAVQAGGPGQQASVFLRGANSKHVLALLDGVRLNDASAPNAQYDFAFDLLGGLDRVEILRGPASAVYGSDAIGGVVNMLPRRGGSDSFEPFWEAAAGTFETRRAVIGAAGTASGYEYGLSADWFATEGHDLVPERMATYADDPDGAEIGVLTAAARHDTGALAFDALVRLRSASAEFDTFSGGPGFDLRADDPDLENESDQRLWRLGADADLWSGFAVRLSGGQVIAERSETDGGLETSSADSERTFADAALQFERDAARVSAGVSFERNEIDTRPQFAAPLRAGEDQYAIYAVGQFNLAPDLTATAAARMDEYENFGEHGTFSAGLVYDAAPLRVFASYGEAFKAPSLSERFETSFFNIGNPELRPETSRSWEIGADLQLGDNVRAGGSYYRTRITDLIEYDFAVLQNVNIGRADIDGAEAYVEAAPAPWTSLRVAYSWTDAINGDTGEQLSRRPEHAWRIEGRIQPAEGFTLTAAWDHVGERTDVAYDDAGLFLSAMGTAEPYDVGAIAATFDVNADIQVFARVDNVTDETYEQPLAFASRPRAAVVGLRARR